MAVRYDANRLAQTGHVKRVCLAAAAHLCDSARAAGTDADWSHLRSCTEDVPAFQIHVRGCEWDSCKTKHVPTFVVPRVVLPFSPSFSERVLLFFFLFALLSILCRFATRTSEAGREPRVTHPSTTGVFVVGGSTEE